VERSRRAEARISVRLGGGCRGQRDQIQLEQRQALKWKNEIVFVNIELNLNWAFPVISVRYDGRDMCLSSLRETP
jgi:hypothetical protein